MRRATTSLWLGLLALLLVAQIWLPVRISEIIATVVLLGCAAGFFLLWLRERGRSE